MSEEVDLDGLLFKRFGTKNKKGARLGQKKWNLYYVNLMGGALYYYKDEEADKPKGTIKLGELTLDKNDSEGSKKPFCFSLKNGEFDFLFRTETEEEWKQWTSAIENNRDKPVRPPLNKEKKKSRAQQLAFKAKKNMISKAATSAVGKKVMKSQAPEEVTNLIQAVKTIVEKATKSSKKASDVENAILKLGIKCYFVIDDGRLKMEDILVADKPFRQALERLSKCYDHVKLSRSPNTKALQEQFQQVQKLLEDASSLLSKMLAPYVKEKNLQMINENVALLANAEFLLGIFTDESLDEPLQDLISAGEHYTQFHFYAD